MLVKAIRGAVFPGGSIGAKETKEIPDEYAKQLIIMRKVVKAQAPKRKPKKDD